MDDHSFFMWGKIASLDSWPQDLGRNVAHNNAPDELGKYSRLWLPEDIGNVLKNQMGQCDITCCEIIEEPEKCCKRNSKKLAVAPGVSLSIVTLILSASAILLWRKFEKRKYNLEGVSIA